MAAQDKAAQAAAADIEFTDQQQRYIDAPLDRHVYLRACPGSGKTEVVAAKVCKIIQEWNHHPSGIALLTFLNSAADELQSRVYKYLREPMGLPHYISTFDSFVLTHLLSSIASEITGFQGRDGDFRIRIIDKSADIYRTRNKICGRTVSACRYNYDKGSKRFVFSTNDRKWDNEANLAQQDEADQKTLLTNKKRLWAAGFATYGDIDILALVGMQEEKFKDYFSRIARRFPLVIVDECQDLSAEQLLIVKRLSLLGVKFHFVGDLNQSIYGFRKSNPASVRRRMEELGFEEYVLNENWRSSQAIVDVCSNILQSDRVVGNPRIASVKPRVVEYQNCPSEVLPAIREMSLIHDKVVIVARGYTTLQRLRNGRAFEGIELLALACLNLKAGRLTDIPQCLETFGKWLAARLELQVTKAGPYCPMDIESKLAWRIFLHDGLQFLVEHGIGDDNQTWSNWARAAKIALGKLPDQTFVPVEVREHLDGLRGLHLRARSGQGKMLISERLAGVPDVATQRDCLRFETIHGVKGETHDVTVVVSSQKPGVHQSHWKDWLRDRTSEAARFAYVASSRPKHVLIWAVKKLKAEDRLVLEGLGFELP